MALRQLYREEEKYRNILGTIIQQESDSRKRKYKQLYLLAQPERLRISTTICDRTNGRKDLVYPVDPTADAVPEEVVVNVQGYAVRVNLPPITSRESLPKNLLSAKQSIVLTGLGTKEFSQAARAVLAIHSMFASSLPGDTLIPWSPITDSGHKCLEFSNRYFSTGQLDGTSPAEFDVGMDPKGILAGLEVNGKYTDDNIVLYFERVLGDADTEQRYMPIKPVAIRPGQLVEAQVSFSIVPITKGRHIMLCKLRSVCILSKQVQDDADDALFNDARQETADSFKSIKRRVGYDEEGSDTEGSSVAFKRMRIDGSSAQDEYMKQV